MIAKNRSLNLLFSTCALIALAACSGSSPTPVSNQPVQTQIPPPPPPPPPPSTGNVTLSGALTFERVPLNSATNGLDYDNSFPEPIRGAQVRLLDSNNIVIDQTEADSDGFYSFEVPVDTSARVQVRAAIDQSNFNFQVVDNTSDNALYTLQGSLQSVGNAASQTRNLFAASGWTGSSYTQTRAAAPFALLDTVYGSIQDFIAIDPEIDFPRFDILWSVNNRPERGDVADGEIGSSSFTISNGRPVIRIVGEADNDTDEYDPHVVTHEFGHYIENQLSRSDSIGGPHSLGSRLDPRVAFSEGWGNALSAILTGDTIYRDSLGRSQSGGFAFDIENNRVRNQGWYSESSVQSILYDLFDSNDDGPDQLSLGLGPIYSNFIDPSYLESEVAATIFSFIDNLLTQNNNIDAATLANMLDDELIFGRGPEGRGEINDGGLSTNLPIYRPIQSGGAPLTLCSVNDNGLFNRLGNRVFLTFEVANEGRFNFRMARTSGPNGRDPDFRIFERGRAIAGGISPDADLETASIRLEAGRYVISALDDRNARLDDDDETGADSCYSFSITGG